MSLSSYSVYRTYEVQYYFRMIPSLDAVANGGEPPQVGAKSRTNLLTIAYCLLPLALKR
ncbi:MAG: hypothetical protein F6K55_08155 [Moorea sp. SIO4A3]|nr:hypothetical protein [Moorena sp. SIO4A3]